MNASITHYAEGFGRHDLKFGVEIERSKARDRYLLHQQHLLLRLRRPPYYAYGYGYDLDGPQPSRVGVRAGRLEAQRPADAQPGRAHGPPVGGAPGQDGVYTNTMFAPRLGFAFDLTGNHTTVLKGSYSQYYEGIFNDVYKPATTGYEDRISWDMAGCPAYGPQDRRPTTDARSRRATR